MSGAVVNMFTSQKIKLHGMHTSKWTTKDKITQYKGLINLYRRDRKIIEGDTNVARKKLHRELKDLAQRVHIDRDELDNAIRGDKQQLRNILAENKELQLAYQNSQPEKIIESVQHLNFTKRKALDKLIYQKNLKSQKLVDLKLEESVLEDRLKYAFLGQIQQEKEAQIITGKVQDAILRREGALAIRHIYKDIIDIMKKDALYFNAILESIMADGYAQSKCCLGATKLGQLATEYLDDRKIEFYTLEKIIIKDMQTRKNDIKMWKHQAENASNSLKQILRKDSDITTCEAKVEQSSSLDNLNKEIGEIQKILSYLKDSTKVPTFRDIFPCLQEQMKQNKRLRVLNQKCERNKDFLQNKLNHAEVMIEYLKNTMVETTFEYKRHKKDIYAQIDECNERRKHIQETIASKRDDTARLRIALRQLLQLSYLVKTDDKEPKKKKLDNTGSEPKIKEVPPDETDGCKIIQILIEKIGHLIHHPNHKREAKNTDEEFKHFEWLMVDRLISPFPGHKQISSSSLLQGLFIEANQALTREEIKRRSQAIVAANTKTDDSAPVVGPKKKTKFSRK